GHVARAEVTYHGNARAFRDRGGASELERRPAPAVARRIVPDRLAVRADHLDVVRADAGLVEQALHGGREPLAEVGVDRAQCGSIAMDDGVVDCTATSCVVRRLAERDELPLRRVDGAVELDE